MRRCATCRVPFSPAREHHAKCWPCWVEGQPAAPPRGAEPEAAAVTFDSRTLRRILALVHPDRHEGRERESTEVSQIVADALDMARAAERERVPR